MSRYGSSFFHYPHMYYHLILGGILMKPQDLTVLCRCSEGETSIAQIIQSSFTVFLKKELQNVEKCLRSVV